MKESDEYKQLMEEKHRIEARLKVLKHKRVDFDKVKLERQRWYKYGREAYNIKIKKHSGMINSENNRFYTIIEDFNLDKSIEVLTSVIDDLDKLLEYLLEEQKNERTNEDAE